MATAARQRRQERASGPASGQRDRHHTGPSARAGGDGAVNLASRLETHAGAAQRAIPIGGATRERHGCGRAVPGMNACSKGGSIARGAARFGIGDECLRGPRAAACRAVRRRTLSGFRRRRREDPREVRRSLEPAVVAAFRILAAEVRPALVDRASHRVSVQRRAPSVVETAHDRSAPGILLGQCRRDVVVAHEHDFQPAAAGLAGGAGDGRDVLAAVGTHFGIVHGSSGGCSCEHAKRARADDTAQHAARLPLIQLGSFRPANRCRAERPLRSLPAHRDRHRVPVRNAM